MQRSYRPRERALVCCRVCTRFKSFPCLPAYLSPRILLQYEMTATPSPRPHGNELRRPGRIEHDRHGHLHDHDFWRRFGRPLLVLGIWVVAGSLPWPAALRTQSWAWTFPDGRRIRVLEGGVGPGLAFLSGWISFFAGFRLQLRRRLLLFQNIWDITSVACRKFRSKPTFALVARGECKWVSIGVIFFFAAINILGLPWRRGCRIFDRSQAWRDRGVLISAFAVGHGNWAHFQMATARTSSHGLGAQFAVSLIFVMFAYSGWNAASYVAEEIKDRNVLLRRWGWAPGSSRSFTWR